MPWRCKQTQNTRGTSDCETQWVKPSSNNESLKSFDAPTQSLGSVKASLPPRGYQPCPADARPSDNDIGPPAALARRSRSCRLTFLHVFPFFCAVVAFLYVLTLRAMASSASPEIPSSILIVGSGAFGLSTAYSLCQNPRYKDTSITIIDRQPFPTPDGSSVSRASNLLCFNTLL